MANQAARTLRKNQTDAERVLWRSLRELKNDGFHFRRQAPLGDYVVDFVCHSARLVIEVDGGQHGFEENIKRDSVRTEWLKSRGYTVLRFWNNEVMENCDGVVQKIMSALELK